MLALIRDDAEMNDLVPVASLRLVASCVPAAVTVPSEALAYAEARIWATTSPASLLTSD